MSTNCEEDDKSSSYPLIFSIRNQIVIIIKSNCTALGAQIKLIGSKLHLKEQRDKKTVSDVFHRVYLEGNKKYKMIKCD